MKIILCIVVIMQGSGLTVLALFCSNMLQGSGLTVFALFCSNMLARININIKSRKEAYWGPKLASTSTTLKLVMAYINIFETNQGMVHNSELLHFESNLYVN